jgi:hypothetical protein
MLPRHVVAALFVESVIRAGVLGHGASHPLGLQRLHPVVHASSLLPSGTGVYAVPWQKCVCMDSSHKLFGFPLMPSWMCGVQACT